MRFLSRIPFLAALAGLFLAPQAWSRQIQLTYTAQVVTVTGTPFGLANLRGKTMTGYFWYDTATTDTNKDTSRGTYEQTLGFSGFSGTLDSTIFMGSKTPLVTIENISNNDTFRYQDGVDGTHPNRMMTVNGVVLPTAQLSLAVSSDKNPLNGDLLPDPFPFASTDPHTFSLSDKNGQMLLQFSKITDSAPAPAGRAYYFLENCLPTRPCSKAGRSRAFPPTGPR